MDYPCMQRLYYAVRLWYHTERKTQTINATKHQGAAGRQECSPGKVLQSENQSKHVRADIGLGFLIRCLEQSRGRKDKSVAVLWHKRSTAVDQVNVYVNCGGSN